MTSLDLFILGIRNLWRRKLRTFLTVLGVVIGATSIIVMISFGLAISVNQEAMLSRMGDTTTLTIYPQGGYGGMYGISERQPGQKPADEKPLNAAALAEITRIPHVKAVSPVVEMQGNLKLKKMYGYAQIMGIDERYFEDFGLKPAQGRGLLAGESGKAIGGFYLQHNFYDPNQLSYSGPPKEVTLLDTKIDLVLSDMIDTSTPSPFDEQPTTQLPKAPVKKIEIVGMLGDQSYEYANALIMPLKEVEKLKKEKDEYTKKLNAAQQQQGNVERFGSDRKNDKNTYSRILIKADDIKNVEAIQETLKAEGYQVSSMLDMSKELANQTRTLQLVLAGIGAVSLIVAAIGIMNTMVMSIYERTKEIGVMKVIGASISNIRNMFLIEASLIGLIGGIFGVTLSLVASHFINQAAAGSAIMGGGGEPTAISVIPLWLILLALLFSMAIGVVSGYYPAVRATRLSALEAMRAE